MASLNPQVKDTASPRFTGIQSEQPKAATYNAQADVSSSDMIMKDLANVIPTLAEAGDRYTKTSIDNSIYDQNDKLNREFGASDTIALNNADVPAIPGSLENSAKNLQRINRAYQSGAISKTTFDVKVASMASDLRAQYSSPYLRDYIDKKVQDVTGVDPQNQVRKDIFAAVSKGNESALWEQHKKQELASSLAKDGVGIPNWENLSLNEMINKTAASQKVFDQHKRYQAIASDATTAQGLTDDDHTRAAQQGVQGIVIQNLDNVNSGFGKTRQQIEEGFKNVANMAPEQKAKFVQQVQQFHDKVLADATTWVTRNYTGGNLDKNRLDQILTPVRAVMDNYVTAAQSGDTEYFKYLNDGLTAMKTRDDMLFLTVPKVRQAASANRVLGNVAGAAAMEPWLPQITKDADRTFVRDEINAIYGTDKGQSTSQAYRNLRDHGVRDVRAFDAVVGQPGSILEDVKSPPEAVKKATRALYGADNYKFISGLPDNQKAKAYAMMYSPNRTKAMERIRDAGDMESYQAYVTSAKQMFGPTFRQAAMNMQQNSFDPNTYRVTYNADTHQFQFDSQLEKFSPRGHPIAVPSHPEVDYINAGLRAIAPVLESNGQNVENYLNQQFQEVGLTGPPGGWRQSDNALKQLGGAFYETKAAVDMQNGSSKLGGPGTPGTNTLNNTQQQMDTRTGILSEMKEVQGLYDKAASPEDKARYGKMLDDLHEDYAGAKSSTGVSPTFGGPNPRGAPNAGVPSDEQSAHARDVIDGLTGLPSFAEAIKNGDVKGAALAAATILPFPVGKIGKAAKAVEGGAEVVSNVTREARGAAKGLEAEAARQTAALKELKSVDVSKLSDEGLQNVEDQLRKGLASKALTPDQVQAIFDKVKEVSIEMNKRNPGPNTPAEAEFFNSMSKTVKSIEADEKLAKNKGLRVIEGDKE